MTVLALLLLLQSSPAEDARGLFEAGQTLIAEGDTLGAVAAWEGALATGWTSAAAEHNLGTVALARRDLGAARLHLERAARLAPWDAAVARNLALARERAGDPGPGPMARAFGWLGAVLSPLGAVALALTLVFAALAAFIAGRRAVAVGVGAMAVLAVVVAGGVLVGATAPRGVVLADVAAVEEAGGAEPVARLNIGETVWVGEERDGWRAVRIGRKRAFVPAEAVAPI